MSDGNFNRQLLPKNELAAGLRAGKAQMRTKAEQAFLRTLRESTPQPDEEHIQCLLRTFMQHLRQD